MNEAILEMRSITKEFPGVKALSDVTLTVNRGEIHAICGENGAGKSTLMKVLSGVYPHGTYDGEIVFEGQSVAFKDIRHSEAAGIVIIHQELALIPELSVAENIFLGNETAYRGVISWDAANHRAIELLARVGLRENPLTPVKHLGIGKQQLVEIAKALGKDVKLLILDEPTAALNDDDSQHLLDLLKGLQGKGITSIMISHKLNEIERVADAITILRDGKTIETLDVTAGDVDEDRIIRGMVGRDLEHRFPDHTPDIGEVMFEVSDWTVHHPLDATRVVIRDANLTVRAGEIVGIAGLMGAGRTELARSIFGRSFGSRFEGRLALERPGAGAQDRACRDRRRHRLRQRGPQGTRAEPDRRHQDLHHGRRAGEAPQGPDHRRASGGGGRRGIPQELQHQGPERELRRREALGRQPAEGRALEVDVHRPQLLILDEPTRGIDVGAKYEIYGIIQELARSGRGVLVISSELPELLGLCDRIYTLAEGVITHEFEADEATQESLMRYMTVDARYRA